MCVLLTLYISETVYKYCFKESVAEMVTGQEQVCYAYGIKANIGSMLFTAFHTVPL